MMADDYDPGPCPHCGGELIKKRILVYGRRDHLTNKPKVLADVTCKYCTSCAGGTNVGTWGE